MSALSGNVQFFFLLNISNCAIVKYKDFFPVLFILQEYTTDHAQDLNRFTLSRQEKKRKVYITLVFDLDEYNL